MANELLTKKELLEKISNDLEETKLLLRAIANKLDIADVSDSGTALPLTHVDTALTEIGLSTQVGNILKELGAPCSILGYRYACDAIIYILNNNDRPIPMTKELYPAVAKLHYSTPSRVERAIRHLIVTSLSRGNIDYINKLFGYSISHDKGKPTNGEFLYAIANELEQNKSS